jgi:putative addiction module component (TIGR02574 family)
MTNLPDDLKQLTIPERLALVEALWDSIDEESHPSFLTDAKREELDRRSAEHQVHPEDVIPWEQVKTEALARFGK